MKVLDRKQNKKDIKGKFFSRSGMAIELTLFVISVVFLCSTLLVSSAVAGSKTLAEQKQMMQQRVLADELAERILANPKLNMSELDDRFDGYSYQWDYDSTSADGQGIADYTARLIIRRGEDSILTVETRVAVVSRTAPQTADVIFEILAWQYH